MMMMMRRRRRWRGELPDRKRVIRLLWRSGNDHLI